MKNKKSADKKREKRRKKLKSRKNHIKYPNLQIELTKSESLDDITIKTILASLPKAKKLFWELLPAENKDDLARWQRQKFRVQNESEIARQFADFLREAIQQVNPQYGYNYAIEVHSRRMMRFELTISVLEVQVTSNGNVHILPDLRFPANKRLGLSTHAIGRLDTRLHDAGPRCGAILHLPLVLIPYNEMYGLYCTAVLGFGTDDPNIIEPCTIYALMGYLPITIDNDLMVGITLYKPGFNKTPEQQLTADQINNRRILASYENKLYKFQGTNTLVPLKDDELLNPNLNMLRKLDNLVI